MYEKKTYLPVFRSLGARRREERSEVRRDEEFVRGLARRSPGGATHRAGGMAARPRSGRHTLRLSTGTYSGDWRDGKKHGQGTYTFDNGDRWVRGGGRARAREEMRERGALAGVEGGSGA